MIREIKRIKEGAFSFFFNDKRTEISPDGFYRRSLEFLFPFIFFLPSVFFAAFIYGDPSSRKVLMPDPPFWTAEALASPSSLFSRSESCFPFFTCTRREGAFSLCTSANARLLFFLDSPFFFSLIRLLFPLVAAP